MDAQRIKNDVVEWMVRKKVTGGKKHQIETVVGYALESHEEGVGKDLIDEMLAGPRHRSRATAAATARTYNW